MIVVDMNASGLVSRMNDAAARFERIGDNMLKLCDDGAAHLRDTDWYQNQTGQLRANTQAVRLSDDAVELHMETDYAVYVKPEWSGFDEVAEQVHDQIITGIRGMVDAISGGGSASDAAPHGSFSGGGGKARGSRKKAARAPGVKSWREFTKGKMGEYMRRYGGHGAAMKKLGEDYAAHKAGKG